MYFDTPRDYIGGVYESLLYGDQPLGWDIIGRKETVRGAKRDTFLAYLGGWYQPERMVLGIAGRIGDDAVERAQSLLGDLAGGETGDARAGAAARERAREGVHEAVRPGARHPRRAELPARASRPVRAADGRDRARRRHVVAPVHRGARAARPRLLRLRR